MIDASQLVPICQLEIFSLNLCKDPNLDLHRIIKGYFILFFIIIVMIITVIIIIVVAPAAIIVIIGIIIIYSRCD